MKQLPICYFCTSAENTVWTSDCDSFKVGDFVRTDSGQVCRLKRLIKQDFSRPSNCQKLWEIQKSRLNWDDYILPHLCDPEKIEQAEREFEVAGLELTSEVIDTIRQECKLSIAVLYDSEKSQSLCPPTAQDIGIPKRCRQRPIRRHASPHRLRIGDGKGLVCRAKGVNAPPIAHLRQETDDSIQHRQAVR